MAGAAGCFSMPRTLGSGPARCYHARASDSRSPNETHRGIRMGKYGWKWPLLAGLLAMALLGASANGAGVEPDADAAAQQALQHATGVAWIIHTDPHSGAVRFAAPKDGAFELPAAGSPAEAALAFLTTHRRIFGMQDPAREWVVTRTGAAGDGSLHIRFAQIVNNVPVYGAVWDAHFNAAGRLTSTSGDYAVGAFDVSTRPRLSATAAADRARLCVAERAKLPPDSFTAGEAELEIFPSRNASPALAWRVLVRSSRFRLGSHKLHLDDRSGTVLAEETSVIFRRAPADSGPVRAYPEHCLPEGRRTP